VLASAVASINIFGGFLVTHRMLAMFRRGDPPTATPPDVPDAPVTPVTPASDTGAGEGSTR
jgi:H+-translocating NAD(P) transhydrogenase subunit alpha